MEYKNIFPKTTLQTQRKTAMSKKVNYNKYNKFLISIMKGITRDQESIAKDYENLFYIMKDQCKKFLALHFMPYIPIAQYVP